MIRKIAGVAFGAIIVIALIIVVQMIGHAVYPAPPGIDFGNPASVATLMFKVPAGALLFVIPHPSWFAVSAIVGIVATVLVTGRLAPLLIAERHK